MPWWASRFVSLLFCIASIGLCTGIDMSPLETKPQPRDGYLHGWDILLVSGKGRLGAQLRH